MELQRWTVAEPYLDIRCALGEGPYYDEERNELRFVDIHKEKLHVVDLGKGPDSLKTIETGIAVGVTSNIEGDDTAILAGVKDGITKFNPQTRNHEYLAKFWTEKDGPEKLKLMRANDGAADSGGRFWVGTMEDVRIKVPADEGVLFRLDPDGSLHRMLEKLTIPNGISWNKKNDTMYVTDTVPNKVYAFDYVASTGDISNQRVFFHNDEPYFLDGHVRDDEDCIWHACYHGAKVLRISPQGQVIGEISLPTRNITCPVFAGTVLFITSAEENEPDKYPESAKNGGNVFRVDVGVKGRPKFMAKSHFT